MKCLKKHIAVVIAIFVALGVNGQSEVEYTAGVIGNVSRGDFAPYFISALNDGKIVRKTSALFDVEAQVDMDFDQRFSWGGGIELLGGYSSANEYARWSAESQQWTNSTNRPAALWIQQLYGEIKYRGVFLRLGQKSHSSALLDESLSSGDLSRSSNARGIPGVETGFVDFQNIPFTNGWVQIEGVVEYGRFIDDDFNAEQFNYYNYNLTRKVNYLYRRCYFRTKPSERFSVTVGMQATGEYGGSWYRYSKGEIVARDERGFEIKDVFDMFIPTLGTSSVDGYHEGNSLGTWDLKARYRLNSGTELSFVFQGPWEDGSGIGRANGFDGLWGLYYNSSERALVTGAAIEYLDFTNQSGPIHWSPNDLPGTTITSEVIGGDDYYNNEYYAGFTNYGMAIATPFLVSPIYNTNGFSGFANNCARGVNAAVKGCIGVNLDYTVKYSWQQAWGRGRVPSTHCKVGNSMLLAADWNADVWLMGLKINAKLALDAGSLRGDNFGILLGLSYNGSLTIK